MHKQIHPERDGSVKTEAETGVMLVQAKERQGFLVTMEARREAKRHLPGAFRECSVQFSTVQLLSRVRLFATPWTAARQASLSITNSQTLLKLMSIELVMPSNHLVLCHPLLLPSIFPSIRVFNQSVHHIRWPQYWSFSVSISPSSEYSGLISFTGLIYLHSRGLSRVFSSTSLKASILWCSAFFVVHLSHPQMKTEQIPLFLICVIINNFLLVLFSYLFILNHKVCLLQSLLLVFC